MFKVALIGCGRIACQLEHDPLRYKPCTHLGALRYWKKRHQKISFSAFCDTDAERAKQAAVFAEARDTLISRDAHEVISTHPDLLVIAATTHAHAELLLAALDAGIPRIVLEKPVALSANEAGKLQRAIRRSRSVVLPNYERRYHPKYLRLRDELGSEKRPGSYRAFFSAGGRSLYAGRNKNDEGVLLHDTTHLLDLAQFLYGPLKRHSAIAEKRRHFLMLEHTSGATGSIETVLGNGVFHLEMELHLAQSRVIVGNGFLDRQPIRQSPHYRSFRSYAAGKRQVDKAFPLAKNPFIALYREAIFGKPTNTHFKEALENVRILCN